MNKGQPGILLPIPPHARYLTFTITQPQNVRASVTQFPDWLDGDKTVIGLGESLIRLVGGSITGLRPFPSFAGPGLEVPATPAALWCWLRSDDRGELVHRARQLESVLQPAFHLDTCIDAFVYRQGRDLTGYEDGTENPTGDDAVETALMPEHAGELAGSSFVAVQQWIHDFSRFDRFTSSEQDNLIGRRRRDNEELADAPPSAHVKRTAQESIQPPAFVLRRSMPWSDGARAGLVFVAFGHSTEPFEALLARMVGQEDGIADGLFKFTRPVTGAFFWCPGMRNGCLDLRALAV